MGLAHDDEPTRFLSREEMERLNDDTVFTGKATSSAQAIRAEKPAGKIKIESVKPSEIKKMQAEQKQQEAQAAGQEKFDNTAEINGLPPQSAAPKKRGKKKYVKYILLILGFIIAIAAGFYLAFTWTSKTQSEMNAKAHDVQQLQQQEAQLDDQQQFLQKRRQELEDEKAQLDQQRKELDADKSFITALIDKVTGKQDQQDAQSQELQAKIDKAQSMIDEVSSQMKDTDSLKSRITQLKDAAEGKAAEQNGTLESIRAQVQNFLNNFLR